MIRNRRQAPIDRTQAGVARPLVNYNGKAEAATAAESNATHMRES
jgi:hypothetical protein